MSEPSGGAGSIGIRETNLASPRRNRAGRIGTLEGRSGQPLPPLD